MLFALAAVVACAVPVVDVHDTVNRVVGDASAFDVDVDALTEPERIQRHLAFVSAALRTAPTDALAPAAAQARAQALDNLDAYAARGVFPRRTDDSYAGRRPRFVDDRGVFCAVGQLMADSGHSDLAEDVDAAFEYAYVDDIDDAALVQRVVAWADEHGFTVDELALIQPSYDAPPTKAATQSDLKRAADRVGLACAVDAKHMSELVVDVDGQASGAVVVQPTVDTPFARCVANHMSGGGGGAYRGEPETFRFRTTLAFATPRAQLQAALRTLDAPSACHRRPGPLVGSVRVDVTAGDGLAIAITTAPENADVDACVEAQLERTLARFARGTWRLRESVTVPLRSGLAEGVRERLWTSLQAASTACFPADGRAPKRLKARVRAAVDDAAFDVDVAAGAHAAFAVCVEGEVATALLRLATTRVPTKDAFFDFVRIDEAVDVRGEAPVVSPAAAAKARSAFDEARRRRDDE